MSDEPISYRDKIHDIHNLMSRINKESVDKKIVDILNKILKDKMVLAAIKHSCFKPFEPDTEAAFNDYYYNLHRFNARMSIICIAIFYFTFGLIDLWALPSLKNLSVLIRFGVTFSVVIPAIIISFTRFFKPFMQPIIFLVVMSVGLNMIHIIAMASPQDIGFKLYPSGLLLILLSTYAGIPLHFIYAVFFGWGLLLSYDLVALYIQNVFDNVELKAQFILSNYILICANIIGMVQSYFIEIFHRKDFLQREIILNEQHKTEELLLNILPKEVLTLLRNDNVNVSDYYEGVSILFADVVNFTTLSSNMPPIKLVALLDEVFSDFDKLVEFYGLEKIKTIGDCYMVAAGVPTPLKDHAKVISYLALDMQAYIEKHIFQDNIKLAFRIGINSGPVVAGVIGRKKFAYDLWGDAVNTASRMESYGSAGKIQISNATYSLIKDDFNCEPHTRLIIKGKGEMDVYFLNSFRAPYKNAD